MLSERNISGVATRVLSKATIDSIRLSSSYHFRGWRILDRWALSAPERLQEMEAQDEFFLLSRLLKQQRIEHDVLTSSAGSEMRSRGLAEHEILSIFGISIDF
ncbi:MULTISPECIES: hypothetical protein [unclassified Pseudomonas]|uniref:hypothetical protein n=1 Tax=unclassified Pseudomonas TaxID=196821 RepID=UPI000BC78913|nr:MULTISPECIES: hypothetical protein [unclassified Pseudomonas]PVZ15363.1 hypothetical protein F474_02138 [Pseudomonas sp. URIL14HWK12:I12]PVZ24737.1 hypothetical protein F470_01793 [Pseudomonas sp. URIL14HWK12:I10]PVZ34583.1 hypothetical protein F472_02139 [Pseudomonas sp. URIL14HWK12:I11]SNZ08721.1 hypothetical protein SAMN05660463_01126 [Pseudomonas sp. URIL14HWK12:I9]